MYAELSTIRPEGFKPMDHSTPIDRKDDRPAVARDVISVGNFIVYNDLFMLFLKKKQKYPTLYVVNPEQFGYDVHEGAEIVIESDDEAEATNKEAIEASLRELESMRAKALRHAEQQDHSNSNASSNDRSNDANSSDRSASHGNASASGPSYLESHF